jgi:hypothetical protein
MLTTSCRFHLRPLPVVGIVAGIIAGMVALLATTLTPTTGHGQTTTPISWKTGIDFERALDASVAVTWKGNPLRHALKRLAESQKVAIFLDRRVDPSLKIDLNVQKFPLEVVLRNIAKRQGLGMAIVGPVVYIGPEATTRELATVAALHSQRGKKLPVRIRSRFTRPKPWQWPELTEPKALLQQMSQDVDVQVQNLDQLPHDLWPAVELPPLDFAHRLSIVLAGFQLSYQLDPQGKALRLIAMPSGVVIQQRHDAGRRAAAIAKLLRDKLPDSQLKVESTKIVATGPMRDQRAIAKLIRDGKLRVPTRPGAASRQAFSLTVNGAPVAAILDKFSSQMGLKITRAPDIQEQLKQRVSFAVKDANLEQLMQAVLKETDLAFKLQGNNLSVFAAGSGN